MRQKILIVDHVHPSLIDKLTARKFLCTVDMGMTYDRFMETGDDYVGLVIRSRFPVDAALLNSKENLRFIIRIGSGMENIDTVYAEKRNIICLGTPEGNAPSVAEHCLGMLISALRHIHIANGEVKNGKWDRVKNKGTELSERTVGIIGYGHTGPAFARLLEPFGCEIYAYDKYRAGIGDRYVKEVPLQVILQKCDVISLHINYLTDNHYFFDYPLIRQIKHPCILINTSRGMVVNTIDLLKGLEEGKIEYACLDVLEDEDLQLNLIPKEQWPEYLQKLAERSDVLLTPHIAGQTLTAEKRHADIAYKKIVKELSNF